MLIHFIHKVIHGKGSKPPRWVKYYWKMRSVLIEEEEEDDDDERWWWSSGWQKLRGGTGGPAEKFVLGRKF